MHKKRFKTFFRWLTLAALAISPACADAQQAISNSGFATGQMEFERTCGVCHGNEAQGTDRAPALANSRRLRASSENEIANIIQNGRGGMPAFSLPQPQLQAIVHFVRSLNVPAFEMQPAGDTPAGEKLFFGSGGCAQCHTALGRGGANGPDLSAIGRQLTVAELAQSLDDPVSRHVEGYKVVNVKLHGGASLRGFARSRGMHDLQLQTFDGQMHLLRDGEYSAISEEASSFMPAFSGTPQERRDLIAFLSSMDGTPVRPAIGVEQSIPPSAIHAILEPAPGDWPTYSGSINSNRNSALTQINSTNISNLKLEWTYSLPYFGLETTPLVMDGVMYVTGPNQVSVLDAVAAARFGITRVRAPKAARLPGTPPRARIAASRCSATAYFLSPITRT